uniref:Ephrin RBD domain-containing protein n=1 Tax=Panagrellus redivivus TaxID=6233 RepID=A0A7E5A1I0_PANRE
MLRLKCDEVTITFTGPELLIEIDNHDDQGNVFVMCFKSYPNSYANRCPKGYASLYYWTTENILSYRYFINRKGELLYATLTLIVGKIVFGEDGSVTLLVHKLPRACTFRLLNAQKVIQTTTTTTTAQITSTTTLIKKASYNTVYFVVGGLAILLILIIVFIVAYLLWSKKANTINNQAVPIIQSDDNINQCWVADRVPDRISDISGTKLSDVRSGPANSVMTQH